MIVTGLLIAIIGGGIGAYFHALEAILVGGIGDGCSLTDHAQLAPVWAIPVLIGALFIWARTMGRGGDGHPADHSGDRISRPSGVIG